MDDDMRVLCSVVATFIVLCFLCKNSLDILPVCVLGAIVCAQMY